MRVFLAVWSLVLVAACLSSQFAAKTLRGGANVADREFDRSARAFLDDFLGANPVFGTANGHHAGDHLLGDFPPAVLASTETSFKGHRAKIAGLNRSELSVAAALDREVVKNAIDLAVFDLTELQRPERDPFFYLEILGFGGLHLLEGMDGPDRFVRLEALVGRMERIPEFLETARTNLKNPPAVRTALALENFSAVMELYRGVELQAARAGAPPEFRERLSRAQTGALGALTEWQTWLSHDMFARSKGDWRLGAAGFARRLSILMGTDIRPDELVAAARGDAARRRVAMNELAARAHEASFPLHRHDETGEALTNVLAAEVLREASTRRTAAGSRVDRINQQIELLRGFVATHRIVALPPSADGPRVRQAPAFVEGLSCAFFSATPDSGGPTLWISPDAEVPGRTPREPSDCELQVIAIHEVYPGHFAQWWHAQRAAAGSLWRRIFPSAAFSEGWAAFAEDLMLDSGFGAGDAACRLLAEKAGLETALNAIIDERFHRGGEDDATLDAWATDLLTREGFHDDAEARSKIRRVRLEGAQLSTYFAGRTYFERAFDEWKTSAGAGHDLREFTDAVLSFGSIPPVELRRLMSLAGR